MENGHFCDFEPSLGDIWTMYDLHHRLIGKCVVDLILVLIELGVTAEALRAKID